MVLDVADLDAGVFPARSVRQESFKPENQSTKDVNDYFLAVHFKAGWILHRQCNAIRGLKWKHSPGPCGLGAKRGKLLIDRKQRAARKWHQKRHACVTTLSGAAVTCWRPWREGPCGRRKVSPPPGRWRPTCPCCSGSEDLKVTRSRLDSPPSWCQTQCRKNTTKPPHLFSPPPEELSNPRVLNTRGQCGRSPLAISCREPRLSSKNLSESFLRSRNKGLSVWHWKRSAGVYFSYILQSDVFGLFLSAKFVCFFCWYFWWQMTFW